MKDQKVSIKWCLGGPGRVFRAEDVGFSLGMGVSENPGPQYSTLNSRILIIRTPQ